MHIGEKKWKKKKNSVGVFYVYIYIYIYVCMYVCIYISSENFDNRLLVGVEFKFLKFRWKRFI